MTERWLARVSAPLVSVVDEDGPPLELVDVGADHVACLGGELAVGGDQLEVVVDIGSLGGDQQVESASQPLEQPS